MARRNAEGRGWKKKSFRGKTMRRLTRRVGMWRVYLRGSETSEEIARGYASIFKDKVDTRPSVRPRSFVVAIDEILVPKVNKIPRTALPIERIRMPANDILSNSAIDHGRDCSRDSSEPLHQETIEGRSIFFFYISVRNGMESEIERGIWQFSIRGRIDEFFFHPWRISA